MCIFPKRLDTNFTEFIIVTYGSIVSAPFMMLALLGWTNYDAELKVQAAETIMGIKMIAVLLPGIVVSGSWAAFKFLWKMDDETRRKIDVFKQAQKYV